ncbi:MAG: hypothetical protein C0621_06885 [Desulfuromonas sp.]|nr:MAG: hypothetical protein C0621_06885 [Desulfuromonas sp.]
MQRRFCFRLFCFILLLLLLSGCEKNAPPPSGAEAPSASEVANPADAGSDSLDAPSAEALQIARALLVEPIGAQVVESHLEALPIWRSFQSKRPALVLMTLDPLLWPPPQELQAELLERITGFDTAQLQRLTSVKSVDPPIVIPSVVDAALRAGWFRELVWVIPAAVSFEELSLDVLRQQFLERNFLSPAEVAGLERSEYGFRGMVRGLPFQAVHPSTLPPLSGKVLFHFGVDFFRELYKGEIKSPLYPLLHEMMVAVREAGWEALAVTVAQGNLGGTLPLATRFIGADVARLMANPQWLAEIPDQWDRRGRALYLDNFFQNDEIFRLYQAMLKEDPADPSVHYALFQRYRQRKETAAALQELAEAVRLDPIYGLEYLDLANLALERKAHGKDLEMLQLAADAMPENPWLKIDLAKAWLRMGGEGKRHALALLQELQQLPWSSIYFPEIPPMLEALQKVAQSEEGEAS